MGYELRPWADEAKETTGTDPNEALLRLRKHGAKQQSADRTNQSSLLLDSNQITDLKPLASFRMSK